MNTLYPLGDVLGICDAELGPDRLIATMLYGFAIWPGSHKTQRWPLVLLAFYSGIIVTADCAVQPLTKSGGTQSLPQTPAAGQQHRYPGPVCHKPFGLEMIATENTVTGGLATDPLNSQRVPAPPLTLHTIDISRPSPHRRFVWFLLTGGPGQRVH